MVRGPTGNIRIKEKVWLFLLSVGEDGDWEVGSSRVGVEAYLVNDRYDYYFCYYYRWYMHFGGISLRGFGSFIAWDCLVLVLVFLFLAGVLAMGSIFGIGIGIYGCSVSI